ncbi:MULTISPECIES: esterase/lipase family protein [unclassified Nitrosospira]|uniref:esterase/lipase family protein n=1 Tax=unclassified Nitrosospira TaxID=2609267 RepID=UPI000D31DB8A|nr:MULTISPECIES: alpha/beta fold hydrolase [unclassified Nitrosospira]PTR14826.1 triacylglycerol lipase [Nitrosospira sp. Nsp2]WON73124.1 alpha/beta fold hydrolase [Nitrosospira sp. Is2]
MVPPTLVLVHGFLGFSHWGPIEYFRGVRKMLLRADIHALIPEVPSAGSIAMRAEVLARRLFRTDAPAFALVGHSMGGLDARYMITHLDPDRRVKSLLTVATPHRGTPLATWFLKASGPIPAWIRHIGKPGLGELTPDARAAMPIPNREDVDYCSYASFRAIDELPFWLRPYGRIIPEDNDGMVPLSSAKWGKFRGAVRADHLEGIGWSIALPDARSRRPFNHLAFWSEVATAALAGAEGPTS